MNEPGQKPKAIKPRATDGKRETDRITDTPTKGDESVKPKDVHRLKGLL